MCPCSFPLLFLTYFKSCKDLYNLTFVISYFLGFGGSRSVRSGGKKLVKLLLGDRKPIKGDNNNFRELFWFL